MTERIAQLNAELAREPGSHAFVALADALRRRGDLAEARRTAERGLERHPYLPDAHDVLARILADLGDLPRARDEWEMALGIDSSHAGALKGLGFLAWQRGAFDEAADWLGRAAKLLPSDGGVRRALERVTRRAPATPIVAAVQPQQSPARVLFADLAAGSDNAVVLFDRDGLVLAGACSDESGEDLAEVLAAELAGVGDDVMRALTRLHLGAWTSMLVELRGASLAIGPASDHSLVLVTAPCGAQMGFLRAVLTRASERARAWLGALA
jgi:tetratricopeptide (TPR) repeat protein